MLLGVLLALAAGTVVIYIVSQATSTGPQLGTVVVAKIDLPANTILSSTTADTTHTLISAAFEEKQFPVDAIPSDAFPWVGETDLESKVNNSVVIGGFLHGDILRQADKRLALIGSGGAGGSLTNVNPAQLPSGDVLMGLKFTNALGGKSLVVAGDSVDLVFTECNLPNAKTTACETQTTLQNLYIYASFGDGMVVVVTHQQALVIQELQQTASVNSILIRKPGDTNNVVTAEVDPSYIAKAFGY
jgi:Flp pilus assembly protein CpaB